MTIKINSWPPLESFLDISGFPRQLGKFVKYEFDNKIYHYGDHFVNSSDKKVFGRNNLLYQKQLIDLFIKIQKNVSIELENPKNFLSSNKSLFSNAYFDWRSGMEQNGFRILPCPWSGVIPDNPLWVNLLNQANVIRELFKSDFNIFYNPHFFKILETTYKNYTIFFSRHPGMGIMIPYTNPFFEGICTSIFKEINKPTFLAIHGCPGQFEDFYSGEHPVDFLAVWGELIKEKFVRAEIPQEQILVSGHPTYSGLSFPNITSSFDNVLVLGHAQMGAPRLGQPHSSDRSRNIDHAWRIQKVLLKLGIKKARFRPHPCESREWYNEFLDGKFFEIDTYQGATDSIQASTLVIGPVSTMALEALMFGKNFVAFIPEHSHYNPIGHPCFEPNAPFDGSDPRLPVARNEDSLFEILKSKKIADQNIIKDFIADKFTPEVIIDAISNWKY